MTLKERIQSEVLKIEGPIVVFGAAGFIGANLFRTILSYRQDVYGITSKPFVPWRLDDLDHSRILHANILKKDRLHDIFAKYKFKTIFDLAAYGAYSKQDNVGQIYATNLIGLLNLLEVCSTFSISAFIHAGSSSEYGLNAAAPKEDDPLSPNSHYAVSKAGAANMIKYYGTIKETPVVNLRFYSIYGPYEDPDRLIPKLIEQGMKNQYPPLVQPEISRDFVFIDDAIYATLLAATNIERVQGRSLNVASNSKTTIKGVVELVKTKLGITSNPHWGEMANRKWDLSEWYGDASLAMELIKWKNETTLADGLSLTYEWQKSYSRPLYEKKLVQDKIRQKLTAVIACYRDAQAIPLMYERLKAVFGKIEVDYEIIFVNDASPDNTAQVLQEIVNDDEHVIAVEHSRNFGSQSAFLSGMELSTGDGVVLLDGDLQDPPELIEKFHEEWQKGFDVVYGRRVAREGNQFLVSFYRLFYRVFRRVSYVPIPLDAGDFSLMDRKVVNELVKLPETDQFMRGLRAWVGFKQTGVDYVRPERAFGVSTNSWRKNIAWARKAIFSFSFVPLELLTYLGWTLTLFSFVAIIAQVIAYFTLEKAPHGTTTIIVLILFFGGIQMLAISILGEYQSKILEESKRRPKFIRKNVYKRGMGD